MTKTPLARRRTIYNWLPKSEGMKVHEALPWVMMGMKLPSFSTFSGQPDKNPIRRENDLYLFDPQLETLKSDARKNSMVQKKTMFFPDKGGEFPYKKLPLESFCGKTWMVC